jgi:hypothetical protein
LDIILVLEAGSYANQYIFGKIKNAGKKLVKAMVPKVGDDERVRVGVILVEGPSTFSAYHKCIAAPPTGGETTEETTTAAPPDMETDCGVKWVHHLYDTGTPEEIAVKIDELTSTLSTLPLTSGALTTAEQEFAFGREDAKSIVIMITDGHPASIGETEKASMALQEAGVRIMWEVTYFAGFGYTEKWASHPLHMNFVATTDPAIDSNYKMNEILSKICPVITGGPGNTGTP